MGEPMVSGMGQAGFDAAKANEFDITDDMIPEPAGFNLLVVPYQPKDTYGDTGIVLTDQERERQRAATVAAKVIAMGPDAYNDEKRFPSGPRCALGDYVIIKSAAGLRFKTAGKEIFRLIYDDQVEAIVKDPTLYSRV